jgi:hypothetical protein
MDSRIYQIATVSGRIEIKWGGEWSREHKKELSIASQGPADQGMGEGALNYEAQNR